MYVRHYIIKFIGDWFIKYIYHLLNNFQLRNRIGRVSKWTGVEKKLPHKFVVRSLKCILYYKTCNVIF